MVIVRDVEFYSLCEHHLLPFYGRVHVAYIPDGKIIGLSKIPRIVDVFARRLQVQERMTAEIAQALVETGRSLRFLHLLQVSLDARAARRGYVAGARAMGTICNGLARDFPRDA